MGDVILGGVSLLAILCVCEVLFLLLFLTIGKQEEN